MLLYYSGAYIIMLMLISYIAGRPCEKLLSFVTDGRVSLVFRDRKQLKNIFRLQIIIIRINCIHLNWPSLTAGDDWLFWAVRVSIALLWRGDFVSSDFRWGNRRFTHLFCRCCFVYSDLTFTKILPTICSKNANIF